MKLKVKSLRLYAGRPIAILHVEAAKKLNVHINERINIKNNSGYQIVARIDTASGLLKESEIGLSEEIMDYLKLKPGNKVIVYRESRPQSVYFIREKIKGYKLSENKIYQIIKDIVENKLTEPEIAYFVSAVYINRLDMKETEYLIKAIVNTGKKLNLGKKIVADKHGIGGVAGNRTTPIIVSICAAAGLVIPKTSSRAITSAGGTADVIETLAKVEFSVDEIKKIISKTGACLVWGGSLGLAPADDKLIQIERLLSIDPEAQLIASILSKKIAAGSTHIILDIPYGLGTKFKKSEAEKLVKKFYYFAKKFNLKLKCLLIKGEEPIGRTIGPALEMKEVISVLKQERNRSLTLEKQSLKLSSELLELTGKAEKGKGLEMAKKILTEGKAWEKFREIIKAQKGDPDKDLKIGKFSLNIKAEKQRKIKEIHNRNLLRVARYLGAPADQGAGIYIHKKLHDKIMKGEKILTFYAESKDRLKEGLKRYKSLRPIKIK